MRTLIVTCLIITSLIATGFLATTPYAQDTRAGTADKTRWLSIPEVHARLESAGYRNIEKIERESGSYEIKAIDRNGQRGKLYVHSQTGEVMNRRYRDARHDTTRDKYDKSDSDYAKNNPRNSADCNERRCRDDLPRPGSVQPPAGK